jgi:hypothetical protein
VPEVSGPGISGAVEVFAEVARRYHAERADRGERAALTAVKFVGAVTHVQAFPVRTSREIQVPHRHVPGVTGRPVPFALGGPGTTTSTGVGSVVASVARTEIAGIQIAHGFSFR